MAAPTLRRLTSQVDLVVLDGIHILRAACHQLSREAARESGAQRPRRRTLLHCESRAAPRVAAPPVADLCSPICSHSLVWFLAKVGKRNQATDQAQKGAVPTSAGVSVSGLADSRGVLAVTVTFIYSAMFWAAHLLLNLRIL